MPFAVTLTANTVFFGCKAGMQFVTQDMPIHHSYWTARAMLSFISCTAHKMPFATILIAMIAINPDIYVWENGLICYI